MTNSVPKLYEYQASITWVLDFMTINHVCNMDYEELYDMDMADRVILSAAESFIYDFYGIDIGMMRKIDTHVDWEIFPEEGLKARNGLQL